ncbi:MAG TPA: DUF58 domain-containing protein [Chloroflexi bacterium]|jgi:uncharacterized protein (DUF58 family)|nr:DUF58 domain-containing protein [Chloroflexota bacterium]
MVEITLRMTSRIPLVAVAVLLLLQIFSPAPVIQFVLVTIAGVLGLAYLWARQLSRGISLQRQRRYGWAQVGDIIEERFILHNESWVPAIWAEVRDFSDLPGYQAGRAVGIGAQNTVRWTTEGRCERRGIYTLGPVEVLVGDPFGMFEVRLTHAYRDQFVVYPPVASLPQLLEPHGLARGAARTNVRTLDMTTNASSVRDWVPGDALNRIHWRTTARRSFANNESIYVKEYDLEPSGDLWIIVDLAAAAHVGEGTESTEEYAVILAASLANQMLRANHAVGMFLYCDEPMVIRPARGPQQLWELLRALAGAHAVCEATFGQVLEKVDPLIGRGISASLITPSTDPEWIRGLSTLLRRGIHCSALLLDAGSFDGHGPVRTGTQGVLGALADLGVSGHIIRRGFRFELLTQRRQQRPEYKVLGTGRVVVTRAGTEEEAAWVSVGQRES